MKMEITKSSQNKNEIYHKCYLEAHQQSYTAYLRGLRCKDEDDFFKEVSAAFQFPWYFGENWPAFDECICDLEWLCFKRIFMVIEDFSQIFNRNIALQNVLMRHLSYMVQYWKGEGISIEIWLNN